MRPRHAPSLRCLSWLSAAALRTYPATAFACSPKDISKASEQSAVTQPAQGEPADEKVPEMPDERAKSEPPRKPPPRNGETGGDSAWRCWFSAKGVSWTKSLPTKSRGPSFAPVSWLPSAHFRCSRV